MFYIFIILVVMQVYTCQNSLNYIFSKEEFILCELYHNMLDLVSKSNVAKIQSLELYKSWSVIPRKYGVIWPWNGLEINCLEGKCNLYQSHTSLGF